MVSGIASDIVLIDINGAKAEGEAIDILQGTPFCNPCAIMAGTYADAVDSDIVIITSGIARKPGQSRLDLAQANVNILKNITGDIVKYAPNATYILVSNPVDVLTYVFCKYSGLPESRVIGSGTILDTSRLRARLSEIYDINQQNVHAYVLGEHGDSSFIPWSLANISNVPVLEYSKAIVHPMPNMPALDLAAIEDYVRKSGSIIIQRKGATYYAVSVAVCHICKSLLSGVDTTLTVSTMLHGEYGIDDVCLSLLNVVGHKGAYNKILLPLNDKEIADLHYSANNLKAVIKSLSL
jgi:L-lactate dehydrogenase